MTKKLAIVGLVGAAFALGVYMGISSGHKSPQLNPVAPALTASPRPDIVAAQPGPAPVAPSTPVAVAPTQAGSSMGWSQFKPERITLPVAGVPLTFRARSIQTEADGRTVWVGAAEEGEGTTLVGTGTQDRFNAIVYTTGGAEVHYAIHEGKTSVREYSPDTPGGCPEAIVVPAEAAAIKDVPVMAGDIYIVKVLYVYTTAAANERGGVDAARAAFVNRLDAANQILAASGVDNVRFSAVDGATKLDFTPDQGKKMSTALIAVAGSSAVGTDRKAKQADFVVYEVGKDEANDFAGLGFQPSQPNGAPSYNTSFSVTNTLADTKGMLHEMAHNFGCDHDRSIASEKADLTGYNFGYRFGSDSGTIMSYAGNRVAYFSNPNVSFEGTALGIPAGQTNAADNARWIREKAAAASVIATADFAPTITTEPAGQTVAIGGTITLTVVAAVPAGTTEKPQPAGAATISYQWRKDNVDIPGATSATYTKSSAVVADSGNYSVYVSNNQGAILSYSAKVVVNPAGAPVITTQPATATLTAGQPLNLSVVATGESLTYQWYYEGYEITGATTASYSKAITTTYDSGRYFVIVKNSLGSTPSDVATVTVKTATVESGGGGGAPSLWFFTALAGLAGLRLLRRKR